jgi:hypothetical protein
MQSSAKTSMNVDTVFSLTPRTRFASASAETAAGIGTSINLG